MAERDGTIVIDTQIDTKGVDAGSEKTEASLRRMAKKVNDIGATAKAALNKQIDAFAKLDNEYAAQEQKVESLRKKVAEYGNQKIPTDEYKEIQTQIEQATAKLNRLKEAQERYIAGGGKKNSNAYRRQVYDMEELANTIKYAEGELKDLEETGKAFTIGNRTKEAMSDAEKLEQAERKLCDMHNKLQTAFANALNSMSISLPHWLEKLTGFSSVGFNVGYWSAPMVPYLAQGAVIPPNKEFMAVLGDQKSGNNIEAPESLIRRIVREESGNGKGSTYNVTAQVNRRTLFDLVLEEGKVRRTVTGRNPFELT